MRLITKRSLYCHSPLSTSYLYDASVHLLLARFIYIYIYTMQNTCMCAYNKHGGYTNVWQRRLLRVAKFQCKNMYLLLRKKKRIKRKKKRKKKNCWRTQDARACTWISSEGNVIEIENKNKQCIISSNEDVNKTEATFLPTYTPTYLPLLYLSTYPTSII